MIPLTYNLRSLMVRRTTSLMTAFGVGLVVMILVLLLSLVDGLRRSLELAGEPHHWILLSRGTNSEVESYIPREEFDVLRTRPEIAFDSSGKALISPEVMVPFNAAVKRAANQFQPAYLRGVYPIAYHVHSGVRLIRGRWPTPGREEMVIGRKQAGRFPELRVGCSFRYGRRNWTIVGVFTDRGSTRESEFWADIGVLQQDARFENGFSAFHVVLRQGMAESLSRALHNDARLTLDVIGEQDFYAVQAMVANRLRALVLFVAAIVGTGAAFGGMNTMYAAVARRSREVGIIRSLGFGKATILASFLAESVMIGAAGGLIGECLAWAFASVAGLNLRLMSVGEFVFSFRFTLPSLAAGLVAAVLIGLFGGLPPAWRAARLPVIQSLREA